MVTTINDSLKRYRRKSIRLIKRNNGNSGSPIRSLNLAFSLRRDCLKNLDLWLSNRMATLLRTLSQYSLKAIKTKHRLIRLFGSS
jgi:hypothetical protein